MGRERKEKERIQEISEEKKGHRVIQNKSLYDLCNASDCLFDLILQRPMVKVKAGQWVKTEWRGQW